MWPGLNNLCRCRIAVTGMTREKTRAMMRLRTPRMSAPRCSAGCKEAGRLLGIVSAPIIQPGSARIAMGEEGQRGFHLMLRVMPPSQTLLQWHRSINAHRKPKGYERWTLKFLQTVRKLDVYGRAENRFSRSFLLCSLPEAARFGLRLRLLAHSGRPEWRLRMIEIHTSRCSDRGSINAGSGGTIRLHGLPGAARFPRRSCRSAYGRYRHTRNSI